MVFMSTQENSSPEGNGLLEINICEPQIRCFVLEKKYLIALYFASTMATVEKKTLAVFININNEIVACVNFCVLQKY